VNKKENTASNPPAETVIGAAALHPERDQRSFHNPHTAIIKPMPNPMPSKTYVSISISFRF
jgi:hypothetical protein